MRWSQSQHRSRSRHRSGGSRAFPSLVLVTSVTAALIFLSLVLPQPIVLPALSLCAAVVAACMAFAAWVRLRANASYSVGALDLAGAFTIVGCAAAIFGEIEPVIEYMQATVPRSRAHD